MSYLLLSPSGVPITGDRLVDVTVYGNRAVRLDYSNRRLVVCGTADTVSFGPDYSPDELPGQAAQRALTLLRRRGYQLFKLVDD